MARWIQRTITPSVLRRRQRSAYARQSARAAAEARIYLWQEREQRAARDRLAELAQTLPHDHGSPAAGDPA